MTKTARDQKLDQLVVLTKTWSARTQEDYRKRAEMLKKLLRGRSVGQITSAAQDQVSKIVVAEIEEFLLG